MNQNISKVAKAAEKAQQALNVLQSAIILASPSFYVEGKVIEQRGYGSYETTVSAGTVGQATEITRWLDDIARELEGKTYDVIKQLHEEGVAQLGEKIAHVEEQRKRYDARITAAQAGVPLVYSTESDCYEAPEFGDKPEADDIPS